MQRADRLLDEPDVRTVFRVSHPCRDCQALFLELNFVMEVIPRGVSADDIEFAFEKRMPAIPNRDSALIAGIMKCRWKAELRT